MLRWFLFSLATALLWVFAAGCLDKSMTEAQQDKDFAVKMAWVETAIKVAEEHGLAYRIEVNASGRPSIGETVDLYIDTGIDARIIMFGNAAAARDPAKDP